MNTKEIPTIGGRIKVFRIGAGYSMETLGNKLNVSKMTISQWENNKTTPTPKNLKALSDIFGTTIDYLLNGSNETPAFVEVDAINFMQSAENINNIKSSLDAFLTNATDEDIIALTMYIKSKVEEYQIDIMEKALTTDIFSAYNTMRNKVENLK